MSNRDGFNGGFWLGTLFGGVVGGIVGASIATQRANRIADERENGRLPGEKIDKRPLKSSRNRTSDRMEIARQSLDRKINDLNNAIDSVRSSIVTVTEDGIEQRIEQIDEDIKTDNPIDAQN